MISEKFRMVKQMIVDALGSCYPFLIIQQTSWPFYHGIEKICIHYRCDIVQSMFVHNWTFLVAIVDMKRSGLHKFAVTEEP